MLDNLGMKSAITKLIDTNMAGQRHRLIDIAINSPDSLDQWQHGEGIITSVAFREEIERYLTTTLSFRPGDIFCVEEPKATAVDLSDSSDWNEGINSEVRLWTQTLGTRHHMRRLRTERAMPERAFNMQVLELLNYPPGNQIDVLDVGSGPVTALGYTSDQHPIKLTCVDPLADEYH